MSIAATIARSGHRVDISKPVEGRDAVGGRETTWKDTQLDVACWFQPASSRTLTLYRTRNITVTHTIYFSSDPELFEGYRLFFDGRYFIVLGVKNSGSLNRLWEVHAREHR